MEIKAQSTFDYDTIKAITHIGIYKKTKPKKAFITRVVFNLLVLAFCFFNIFAFDSFDGYMIFVAVILFLTLLFFIYCYFLAPKISFKKLGKNQNIVNEFVFKDEAILASSVTEEYKGQSELGYSMVQKVIETNRYLLLYHHTKFYFVIDKATITGGSVLEVRRKLLPLLGKKYVVYNY